MSHKITVEGGKSVRLKTAGKYCDRDIVVTAEGGTPTPTQEKTVEITANGTVSVAPDEGYALSKVTANVNVPIPEGYIKPSGTKEITENGTHDAKAYESVNVNVPIPDGYIQPSGTLEVTENGTKDVTAYASVNVNVASSGGGGEFPEGFKRCDYIQFTGEQLVDTGIVGNQDTRINTCFTWGSSNQNHLFGCASSDNTKSITSYMNGSWRFGNKSATKTFSSKNPMLPYSALVDKTMINTAHSATKISDVNDFETVGTLLLGGARSSNGGLPSVGIYGRVYYFYVWQGEEQVLKLIPVTNGTAYRFYDMVSQKLFDSFTGTPLDGGNL